jgi:hypothetical protein
MDEIFNLFWQGFRGGSQAEISNSFWLNFAGRVTYQFVSFLLAQEYQGQSFPEPSRNMRQNQAAVFTKKRRKWQTIEILFVRCRIAAVPTRE